jgi:hypothetical protein
MYKEKFKQVFKRVVRDLPTLICYRLLDRLEQYMRYHQDEKENSWAERENTVGELCELCDKLHAPIGQACNY